MVGRRQDFSDSNVVDHSMSSMIEFGDDDDGIWDFSSLNVELILISSNSLISVY
jgi:hypothetical protein